jgi:hypothetical protein
MANYPLIARNKEGTLLHPQHSFYSDEYTESYCDLFLRDSVVKDDHGKLHKYYRLHAKQPHDMEMAFTYDILSFRRIIHRALEWNFFIHNFSKMPEK